MLEQVADSILALPAWRGARWGMLVVDATTGDTLLSRDADKLFLPASNQKLLTAAIALDVLGPDFRWRTPVLLDGTQHGTTWRGDLVLVGSGDPSWSDSLQAGGALRAFAPIVEALRARGIRKLEGSIVAAGDAFPGSTIGSGWEVEDLDGVYGAAVDELTLNEGAFRIDVSGGSRSGAALRVTRSPVSQYPPVVVLGTTALDGERLRVAYDSIAHAVVVTGSLRADERRVVRLAYRHPNDAVRAAVAEVLRDAGITIDSSVADRRGSARETGDSNPATIPHGDTLVVLESPALSAILPRMQQPSQNQIAELLLRTAGRVATGSGSADSARAVARRTLIAFGVDSLSVAFRDGSGMSRHNFITPRALVQVLHAMHHSQYADVYRGALPVAGVSGTLEHRLKGTPAQGAVQAKTGTLNKARALSGYVTTAGGQLLYVSLLCNNYTTAARDVDEVVDHLLVLLAGTRLIRTDAR